MAIPICPNSKCAKSINLDFGSYSHYDGNLVCPYCRQSFRMRCSAGSIISISPAIDERLILAPLSRLPAGIVDDYQEALACLSVRAWRATAVMCRRAIQGALLEKGIPDQRPMKMIDDAYIKANLLNEKQHKLAGTVTFFGGKGAHPSDDELMGIGEIEAFNGLWVTRELLLALFPSA